MAAYETTRTAPFGAIGMTDAIGDMGDARTSHVDHPPAQIPQARVDPQNTHARPFSVFSKS